MLTAAEYNSLVVRPTVDDYAKNKWDRRRAMLACIVTLHIIDHVVQNRMPVTSKEESKAAEREITRITDHLTNNNNSFSVVRAYATAAKHGKLRVHRDFAPGFDSGRGIPTAPKRWYPDFYTGAGADVGGVVIEWEDRSRHSLVVALLEVRSLLELEFPEIQLPD